MLSYDGQNPIRHEDCKASIILTVLHIPHPGTAFVNSKNRDRAKGHRRDQPEDCRAAG